MSNESQNLSIGGRILIAEKIPAFHEAAAHIYLEDTTLADAESIAVAETTVENIKHDAKETEISFRLDIADRNSINAKNSYSVRVWIDTDGDGKQGAKDLFSDQAYRVLTHGFGDFVEVKLGF